MRARAGKAAKAEIAAIKVLDTNAPNGSQVMKNQAGAPSSGASTNSATPAEFSKAYGMP
jgi:hypothetical protein